MLILNFVFFHAMLTSVVGPEAGGRTWRKKTYAVKLKKKDYSTKNEMPLKIIVVHGD